MFSTKHFFFHSIYNISIFFSCSSDNDNGFSKTLGRCTIEKAYWAFFFLLVFLFQYNGVLQCFDGKKNQTAVIHMLLKILVKCKLWSVVASQFTMNVLKEGFFCFCFFFAISKVLQFLAFNSWYCKLLNVSDDLGWDCFRPSVDNCFNDTSRFALGCRIMSQ